MQQMSKVLGWTGAACAVATMRSRWMRHYLCRYEAAVVVCFIICMWLYVRWITERYRPLIKGATLLRNDIRSAEGHQAQMIDLGFRNLTNEAGDVWKFNQRDFSYFAMQGVRSSMEDRMHYLRDPFNANLSIYGLFDGHGGKFVSEYLESTFSKSVRARLLKFGIPTRRSSIVSTSSTAEHDAIAEAIVTEMHNIDNGISRLDPAITSLTGSTLIAAIVQQNRFLTIVNVGDSRAVVCDRDGLARAVSVDHKPSDELERKRIESAGGFVSWNGVDRVQGILATSRAFGDTYLKRLDVITAHPDVYQIDLAKERVRFLILASDGLWDVLTNQMAVDIVRDELQASDRRPDACLRAAEKLVRTAIARETVDNVSVFVIRFRGST